MTRAHGLGWHRLPPSVAEPQATPENPWRQLIAFYSMSSESRPIFEQSATFCIVCTNIFLGVVGGGTTMIHAFGSLGLAIMD